MAALLVAIRGGFILSCCADSGAPPWPRSREAASVVRRRSGEHGGVIGLGVAALAGRSRRAIDLRAVGGGEESVNVDQAVADHEGVGSDEVIPAVAVGAEVDVDDLALHLDRG
jgi:hypothetical protein